MRIILCGFGVVAQSFSELLESRTHDLYSKFGLRPRIVGVFDSKGCAYDETGLDLKKLNKIKKQSGTVRNYDKSIKQISGKEIIKKLQSLTKEKKDEYRQNIEKDGALERRFQKIIVEETTIEETYEILKNIKDKYENHHNVTYTSDALKACVDLTKRYVTDRFLPDKAIDALDEAGSRVHINNMNVPQNIIKLENDLENIIVLKNSVVKKQKYEEAARLRDDEKRIERDLISAQNEWDEQSKLNRIKVDESHIAEVVSMISGVPVSKIFNKEKSLSLIHISEPTRPY